MTGQRSTGTRRPFAFPAWWGPAIEVMTVLTMLATLALAAWFASSVIFRPAPAPVPTKTVIQTVIITPTPPAPAPATTTTKKATK